MYVSNIFKNFEKKKLEYMNTLYTEVVFSVLYA